MQSTEESSTSSQKPESPLSYLDKYKHNVTISFHDDISDEDMILFLKKLKKLRSRFYFRVRLDNTGSRYIIVK